MAINSNLETFLITDNNIFVPNTVASLAITSYGEKNGITFEEPCQIYALNRGGMYWLSNAVTIPSSVETIGAGYFWNSPNLTTIYVNKPVDSISGAPWGATNATVIWNG